MGAQFGVYRDKYQNQFVRVWVKLIAITITRLEHLLTCDENVDVADRS